MREYYADQIGGRIGLGEARSTPRIPRATMANDPYLKYLFIKTQVLTITHYKYKKLTISITNIKIDQTNNITCYLLSQP